MRLPRHHAARYRRRARRTCAISAPRTKPARSAFCAGHADFLTVLAMSVVTWRDATGNEHHVAVRGGVLMVRDGDTVEVATREAVGEETLDRLEAAVLRRFAEETRGRGKRAHPLPGCTWR